VKYRESIIFFIVDLFVFVDPSPDWIVGVSGLNLCLKNCSWVNYMEVNLYPWDAGTDSGITYTVCSFNKHYSHSGPTNIYPAPCHSYNFLVEPFLTKFTFSFRILSQGGIYIFCSFYI
jgi:hypothetical protein